MERITHWECPQCAEMGCHCHCCHLQTLKELDRAKTELQTAVERRVLTEWALEDALKERDEARAWARYWRSAHTAESRARMEWPEAPAEEEPEWLERDPGPEKEGNDRGAIG